MKAVTAALAAAFMAAAALGLAAPTGHQGHKATRPAKHAASKTTVVYKAHCGMVYSAADAKKYHYICPMDHKPLTKMTVAARPAPKK